MFAHSGLACVLEFRCLADGVIAAIRRYGRYFRGKRRAPAATVNRYGIYCDFCKRENARQGELRTLTTNANRADRGFQFFRSVGLCEGRAYYNRARWHQGARGNSRLQAILPTATEGRDSNRTPL